jgi:hypothetical protein
MGNSNKNLSSTTHIDGFVLASGCLFCKFSQHLICLERCNNQTASSENFDQDKMGSLPKCASEFSGTWTVRAEPCAPSQPNILCQTGNAKFSALNLSNDVYANFSFETESQATSGQSDQAASFIFRVHDKNNDNIPRANALEDNPNFYQYSGVKRKSLKLEPATSSFKRVFGWNTCA